MASKTVPVTIAPRVSPESARSAYEELTDYVERLAAMAITLEQRLEDLTLESGSNLPVHTEWRLAQVMSEQLSDTEVLRGIRVALDIEDLQTGKLVPIDAGARA